MLAELFPFNDACRKATSLRCSCGSSRLAIHEHARELVFRDHAGYSLILQPWQILLGLLQQHARLWGGTKACKHAAHEVVRRELDVGLGDFRNSGLGHGVCMRGG